MNTHFASRTLALVAFIISCSAYKANASHLAAVDMAVEYIGTDSTDLTYKVIVDIYYACEPGSAAPANAGAVYYFSQNAGMIQYDWNSNPSVNCQKVGPEIIVDQLCAQNKPDNSCNMTGSILPGFRLWHNEDTVTLPSRQSDWVFYWSSSARNGGILNLVNPQDAIFVEAGLDNLTRYNNSTPKFTSNPLPYLCHNQPAHYLTSPVDTSADSLVVTNVVPRSSWNTFYTYEMGYTTANPISSATSNPYKVTSYTGEVNFTPTKTGYFVLSYRVDEYDRKTGKHTGFTYRDAQVSVLSCVMLQTSISDAKNYPPWILYNKTYNLMALSAGKQLYFDLFAKSPIAGRNLYMTTNVPLPTGAGFTITGNGTDSVSGAFSWTPDSIQAGDHILSVTVSDSTCDITSPIVSKNHKVILIQVRNVPIGIKEAAFNNKFTIAPNPANDFININSELFLSGDYRIDIVNSIGQGVYSTRTTRNVQQQLSLATFSSGMYIIQLTSTDGNTYRQKLLKH